MDRDLSPLDSPLKLLPQGLAERHLSVWVFFICMSIPVVRRRFSIMFTSPPKRRPERQVESDKGYWIRLTVLGERKR